jgi:ATP-dependent Clp protease protease subunit
MSANQIGRAGSTLVKIPKDWVEAYFEYGVDVTNRHLFLVGHVDETSVGNIIKGLYLMDNQNQQHDPIELRICSYGGSTDDMFALHDVTRTLKSPIHTTGMGKVMSAAILLVACGERGERWAGPNTTFMVHPPSWDSPDAKMHEHEAFARMNRSQWESWYKLMERYTAQPAKFWRRLCNKNHDVYFTADDAKEWGLIDHIWDEKDGD